MTFKEGTSSESKFIEEAEIKVNPPNCGQRVVSSKNYIVAACSQSNIVTVYDSKTRVELCTVNGLQNGNLGTDL